MFPSFEIAPRAALAAPTDPYIIKTQSAVILVASVLSVLGGGWMVISFFVFPALRSFRHQLILGLALSDLVMAVNFLLSSSLNVSSRWIGAPEQAGFCTFNGFMTQVFVIQTDYWVFIIAIYTYFVLTDQKRCSNWIQSHPFIPWILPWLLSCLWAAVGLGVTGYGDIGGWCWFTSDQVRLLVNFVPRWAIIAIMFLMYARLYFILWRAHRRLVSLDTSQSGNPSSGSDSRQLDSNGPNGPAVSARHTRKLKRLARLMLLYPLAYAIVWSLPTCIRIYQTITGHPAPWQLQTIDKACIVLQGFVDAIIYGATESSLSNWRSLFFPRKFPASTVIMGVGGYGSGTGTGTGTGKRTSNRWTAPPRSGDEQLVLDQSDDASTMRGSTEGRTAERAPSSRSGSSTVGVEPNNGSSSALTGEIELAPVKGTRDFGIRKTVDIEVVTSSTTSGAPGNDAPTKPLRAYFPEDREIKGTFLSL
ncbi:hypothetical protein V8F20_008806 [Naviculisporaceae sp. PSN 640]